MKKPGLWGRKGLNPSMTRFGRFRGGGFGHFSIAAGLTVCLSGSFAVGGSGLWRGLDRLGRSTSLGGTNVFRRVGDVATSRRPGGGGEDISRASLLGL
jgi:hypothetical protein